MDTSNMDNLDTLKCGIIQEIVLNKDDQICALVKFKQDYIKPVVVEKGNETTSDDIAVDEPKTYTLEVVIPKKILATFIPTPGCNFSLHQEISEIFAKATYFKRFTPKKGSTFYTSPGIEFFDALNKYDYGAFSGLYKFIDYDDEHWMKPFGNLFSQISAFCVKCSNECYEGGKKRVRVEFLTQQLKNKIAHVNISNLNLLGIFSQ